MAIKRSSFAQFLMDHHLYSFAGIIVKLDRDTYLQKFKEWKSRQGLTLINDFHNHQGNDFEVKTFERTLSDFVEDLVESKSSKEFGGYVIAIDSLVSDYREKAETMQIRIQQSYLDGSYGTTEHATQIQPLANNDLVHDHNNKHFKGYVGTDSDAQYNKSKGYVAALEKKAIRVGLPINGVIYFKNNEIVGSTGDKCGNVMSQCIRVDSPTSGDQHSHPIPLQHQLPYPAHNNDIADLIVECVREDPGYLPRIAKYLADVHETISFNKNQKTKLKGYDVPACPYWPL